MNKGLVIYKSKYGATKKYADMLKDELRCEIYDIKDCGGLDLEKYDWIVFAGGIYGSGIAGWSVFQKKYNFLSDIKLAVFCVGASPYDEKAMEQIKLHNLKDDLKNLPVFYGRGAWDERKMSWKDRTLCRMLQKAVAKKDPGSFEPWMKELLSSMGQVCDWTDKKYLRPLMEFIKTDTLS